VRGRRKNPTVARRAKDYEGKGLIATADGLFIWTKGVKGQARLRGPNL